MTELLEGYVNDEDLAKVFNKTTRTIRRWRNQVDGLPYVKLGQTILYNIETVREWLAQQETQRNPSRKGMR